MGHITLTNFNCGLKNANSCWQNESPINIWHTHTPHLTNSGTYSYTPYLAILGKVVSYIPLEIRNRINHSSDITDCTQYAYTSCSVLMSTSRLHKYDTTRVTLFSYLRIQWFPQYNHTHSRPSFSNSVN